MAAVRERRGWAAMGCRDAIVMAKADVLIEVEAVQAVYGDDCLVLDKYPPHLHLHLKPRTADVSSQQFVEAVLGIRAGLQYPDEPPQISIVDCKGLDEQRQKYLVTSVHDKACELSSHSMLVTLCEEAVEGLSRMNHPQGNCPLCLSPLVEEDACSSASPFMKLIECIIRWWNWLETENGANLINLSSPSVCSGDLATQQGSMMIPLLSVPDWDIEHVLGLVGSHPQLGSNEAETNDDERLLQSESEIIRRHKFEAILKLQQENNGLNETKRSEVLMPGMFISQPITSSATSSDKEVGDQLRQELAATDETVMSGSSYQPSTSGHRNSGMRKHRGRNSRKQVKQWRMKDNSNTGD
ncbi:hypothetical protein RJ640_000723 [Escallonia rubra]|uniref:RWD domain-containing protein n=1 Tax=Escallonia rubra TaxID=112253 RepID=A0AA88QS11_9ASTE|nr:hypothetical protein RJ640_000723 [Escallonia rubra]